MKNNVLLILLMVAIASCNREYELSVNCEFQTIISSEEYDTAPSDYMTIDSVEITDDCLTITFNASGCDGETWEYKLIDSNDVDLQPPTGQLAQRNLRLSLKDNEACRAVITKEASFDISNLRIEGKNQVELTIANSVFSVLYEY